MSIEVKIERDSYDVPTHVQVIKNGFTYDVWYDRLSGYTFKPIAPSPDILEILQLIYPCTEKAAEWPPTFRFVKLDEDGTRDFFETDQAKTDTPTLLLDSEVYPNEIDEGIINRIHYRLNPTNAVTYTLYIYRAAYANDYASNLTLLYESAAAQADDTDYDQTELHIPFKLSARGAMYYAINWSAAPGNTSGFIEVSGETVRETH